MLIYHYFYYACLLASSSQKVIPRHFEPSTIAMLHRLWVLILHSSTPITQQSCYSFPQLKLVTISVFLLLHSESLFRSIRLREAINSPYMQVYIYSCLECYLINQCFNRSIETILVFIFVI